MSKEKNSQQYKDDRKGNKNPTNKRDFLPKSVLSESEKEMSLIPNSVNLIKF